MKIYTRTGDTGDTSLFDGTRVRKDHPRVAAYGDIDELHAWIGLACSLGLLAAPEAWSRPGLTSEIREELQRIQRDLFALGAQLADPADKLAPRVTKAVVGDDDVARLEALIDRLDAELPKLRRFILAGGAPAGAALHVARTICRRAERQMVALDPLIDPVLLRYVNRLSDLLFVMARVINHHARAPEVEW